MKWKKNLAVKAGAFLLAVAGFAAAAMMGWYQIMNFDVIWGGRSPADCYTVRYLEWQDYNDISYLLWLYNQEALDQELDIGMVQDKLELEEQFGADVTNLRWQALDDAGTVRYGNTRENIPARAQGLYQSSHTWTNAVDDAQLGTQENETVSQSEELKVVLWLAADLPVADEYKQAVATLQSWAVNWKLLLAVTIVCAVAGLLLTVYLCAACGHKKGREGIYLNWFHRIPGDLLLAGMFLAGLLVVMLFFEELLDRISYSYACMPMYVQLLLMGCLTAALAALCMGALVTVVARCKAHTVWRNTVIGRLCRLCRCVLAALPLIWKAAVTGAVYLLLTLYVMFCVRWNYYGSYFLWFFLWLAATAALIVYLCLWAWQWKRIRTGAKEIVGGNPDYLIDTKHMLPDLKRHADELNNLGQAISAAVDDRMRSERFKAELITNVSHDLKTPLTSIINYVDLLKKEDIGNPKAAEYIEVLDRKSQRLKKLTEDLVEASKASTGNLAVVRERIGLVQLADQALGEYEERLGAKRLNAVRTFPGEEVWVEADGRHLWRVLDNLLSNCAKYALEGTRVYLEVRKFPDAAVLQMKNISRDELNVPPETLIERFVRGDESRTTEGSGLGLSIAQSLTELQNGRFEVDIDGDLFKATVTLPLAEKE